MTCEALTLRVAEYLLDLPGAYPRSRIVAWPALPCQSATHKAILFAHWLQRINKIANGSLLPPLLSISDWLH